MRLWIPACAGMTMLMVLATAALAQNKPVAEKLPEKPAWLESGYTYSPEGCDFTVSFPQEPYTTKRCDPVEPGKNCTDMTTFTKVFGVDATLLFSVSCNKADGNMYDRYDDNVMRTTLLGMARPVNLGSSETGFAKMDKAKMAVLLGTGKADNGEDDLMYTAQLWIGHNSVFTLEGELRGKYVPDADLLFAEILKTARVRDMKAEPKDEKKDEKKEDKQK